MAPPKGYKPPTYVTKTVMAEKQAIEEERAREQAEQEELEAKREVAAKKFDAKMLARSYTREATKVLVDVMQDVKASAADRITAAKIILERGHGRAPIMVEDGDGIKMPVVFLPVEVNEEKQAITVEAKPTLPSRSATMKPTPGWWEGTDKDPTHER